MKNLFFLIFFIPTVAISQVKTTCAPENLCSEVYEMLSNFGPDSFEQYNAIFINEKEFLILVDQLWMDEERKELIREERDHTFFEERNKNEFKDLIEEGNQLNLNWKKIEFEDFLYRIRFQNGIKELKGEIYFKEGDEHFEIRVQAAFLSDEFHILELERLKTSTDLLEVEDTEEDMREIPAPEAIERDAVEESDIEEENN